MVHNRLSIEANPWLAPVIRGLAVIAACLLVSLALPSKAAADCCVCTDCATIPVRCSAFEGCDFGECNSRCAAAGCEVDEIRDEPCRSVPECRLVLPAPAAGPVLLLISGLLLFTIGAFGLRRRSLPMPVRAASLLLVVLATVTAVNAVSQIRLTGRWQLDSNALGTDPAPQEQWKAHVVVGENGALSGTVELEGFAGTEVASVHGTLAGGAVSGTLRNGEETIAEFQGTVAKSSLEGTFTRTDSGESGTFSWGIARP